jgi:glycosyltransferase involved in cell wall biosynthesis
VDEIIVVDGGSDDDTASIAQRLGARLICEPRRGYGRACAAGVAAASGDVILFLDADGADDPSQAPRLLTPILTREADMVLGSRLAGELLPDAMPWHQRLGNRLAVRLIRRLYALPLTDLGPFRAIRRESLLALEMEEMTHGWPVEMIVKAARSEQRIVEVPVRHYPRLGGRSKISGTPRGSVLAAYHIVRTILRYARNGDQIDE